MRRILFWTWEFGVRRNDGNVLVSNQPEYPWSRNDATRVADAQNDAAERIGQPPLATARVVRRKRWTETVRWNDGWEND